MPKAIPAKVENRNHPYPVGPVTPTQATRSHPFAPIQNRAATPVTPARTTRTALASISTNVMPSKTKSPGDTMKQMELTAMKKFSSNSSKQTPTGTTSNVSSSGSPFYSRNNENSSRTSPEKKRYPASSSSKDNRATASSSSTNSPSATVSEQLDAKLKIFSGTTKCVKYYEKSAFPKRPVGAYLFKLVGHLDSAITQDSTNGFRFTVKDKYDRLKCVYFEQGSQLEMIPRDSPIRIIGKTNEHLNEQKLFQCVAVRRATDAECVTHGLEVAQSIEVINSLLNRK